jgi:hypothetical protein
LPSISLTGGNNCTRDVVTIQAGTAVPGTASTGLGESIGITHFNGDDFADLILGTRYEVNVAPAAHIFYGGDLSTCASGPSELAGRSNLYVSSVSLNLATTSPVLVVDASTMGAGGVVAERGLEFAMGLWRGDAADLVALDGTTPTLYARPVGDLDSTGDERFGRFLAFGGNLDQDQGDLTDVVVGAPLGSAVGADPGRVILLIGGEGTPPVEETANPGAYDWSTTTVIPVVNLDASGATYSFGTFLTSDFDFNGDGLPDLAVSDFNRSGAPVMLFY